MRVESAADSDILERGDSASYREHMPHAVVNLGRKQAVLFLVEIYQ